MKVKKKDVVDTLVLQVHGNIGRCLDGFSSYFCRLKYTLILMKEKMDLKYIMKEILCHMKNPCLKSMNLGLDQKKNFQNFI